MKRFVVALVIFEALIIADVLSTVATWNLGGSILTPVEAFPTVSQPSAQGFAASLMIKLAFSVGAFPLYYAIYTVFEKKNARGYTKALWTVLLCLIAFYSIVVYNNIIVAVSLAAT